MANFTVSATWLTFSPLADATHLVKQQIIYHAHDKEYKLLVFPILFIFCFWVDFLSIEAYSEFKRDYIYDHIFLY